MWFARETIKGGWCYVDCRLDWLCTHTTPLGFRSQIYVANTRKTYPLPESLYGDASTLRLQEDHTTQRGHIRRGQCHERCRVRQRHSSEERLCFLAELERCLPSCLRLWQAFIKMSRTIIYNRAKLLTVPPA